MVRSRSVCLRSACCCSWRPSRVLPHPNREIVAAPRIARRPSLSRLAAFGHSFHFEGAWASSIRIWWHFVMVLVPTGAFVLALREFRRAWPLTTAVPASADRAHEAPEPKKLAAEVLSASGTRSSETARGALPGKGDNR